MWYAIFILNCIVLVSVGQSGGDLWHVRAGQAISAQTATTNITTPNELACVSKCQVTSIFCYAAQYVASTKQCLMQIGCTIISLVTDALSKTYVIGNLQIDSRL